MDRFTYAVTAFLLLIQAGGVRAQSLSVRPKLPAEAVRNDQGAEDSGRIVKDERTHLQFHVPAGWLVARKDGEQSTFHLDARTASRATEMRTVVALDHNPFPSSTFSGALLYLSVTPRMSATACAAQASRAPMHDLGKAQIADQTFNHGHDEHGKICTEARDDVYTSVHEGNCLRFDLVINNFCGGEVSGAQDLTQSQLDSIETRLQAILATVRFTSRK